MSADIDSERYSLLSNVQLTEIIRRMGQIVATTPEDEAMREADLLAADIVEWSEEAAARPKYGPSHSFRDSPMKAGMEMFQDRLSEMEIVLKDGPRLQGVYVIDRWRTDDMSRHIAWIADRITAVKDPDSRRTLTELHTRAVEVADRFVVAIAVADLTVCLKHPFTNAVSARKFGLRAASAWEKLKLAKYCTPEHEALARETLMRAVRYRHDKKLGESQIAAAGRNRGKAERLLAEAREMLRQDQTEFSGGFEN